MRNYKNLSDVITKKYPDHAKLFTPDLLKKFAECCDLIGSDPEVNKLTAMWDRNELSFNQYSEALEARVVVVVAVDE